MKYSIPNFITIINLLLGFICTVNVINSNSGLFILFLFYICLILDFMDGFFARKLNAESEFGKQLDSLADLISFGLLPTLVLFYHLENISDNIIIKFSPLLILVFSAVRLAKFNISKKNDNNFEGLPTPANALFFMSLVNYEGSLSVYLTPQIYLIFIIFFSLLLTSKFEFITFKFSSYYFIQNIERYLIIITTFILLLFYGHSLIFLIIFFYVFLSVSKSIYLKLFFK